MKFSLVIPCYNEEANLPTLLERCKDLVSRPGIEVVLVDNGSTDSTPTLLRNCLPSYPGCRSVRVKRNQGYGFGVLTGLSAARGEILGWTHADMQADPRDSLIGLEIFRKHGESVFIKGRRHGRQLADIAFTAGMSVLESLLLARPLWDINAQPTMFSRRFCETWGSSAPYDFSLDLYAYYHAQRLGLDIHRFPVHFANRTHGQSRWNTDRKAQWRFIRRTVSFSRQLKRSY